MDFLNRVWTWFGTAKPLWIVFRYYLVNRWYINYLKKKKGKNYAYMCPYPSFSKRVHYCIQLFFFLFFFAIALAFLVHCQFSLWWIEGTYKHNMTNIHISCVVSGLSLIVDQIAWAISDLILVQDNYVAIVILFLMYIRAFLPTHKIRKHIFVHFKAISRQTKDK